MNGSTNIIIAVCYFHWFVKLHCQIKCPINYYFAVSASPTTPPNIVTPPTSEVEGSGSADCDADDEGSSDDLEDNENTVS